ISELSAMCSSEGITASILFNRPFSGRIYSLNYATVHECVYYNGNGLESILFSIPAHRCGTRLSRTTRNMVDQMENQVYVQIEKDAQTTADRQFLFVCQLADAKFEKEQPSQGYPVPPEMNKTPSPYRMWTYPEPVKSNTVPRVAAFSSDGHLGNWPIPGARPYAPNVTPVSSWPRQPLPEPIIPQSTPVGALPSPVTTPRNPFLSPVVPPIAPQRTKTDDTHHGISHASAQIFRNPVSSRTPSISDEAVTSSYVVPQPAVLDGRRPVDQEIVTKVPAFPWNKPISYATKHRDSTSRISNSSSNTTVMKFDKSLSQSWGKAKVFKELLPGVELEFETDNSDKLTQSEDQEYLAPPEELSLEIQYGVGPYAPTVNSPVKIGDNISLVVRSKSHMKGENDYDMFVHSCSASDGEGKAKIELVDKNGCATRPLFSSQMKRTKDPNGLMYYFFRITAFKFPGPDDVYFSCSIDLIPFRNAPEICPGVRRAVRQTSSQNELRLFDSVKVELDALASDRRYRNESYDNGGVWVPNSVLAFVVFLFNTLLFAVLLSMFAACFFYRKMSTQNSTRLGSRSRYT
ncbi:hypothetical protein Angca_001040, partial [Angiostrongylus cantonensis]